MLLKILRKGIGSIIVLIDKITRPKQLNRSTNEQEVQQQKANNLTLYQFYACPFCIKTRRAIHRLNINITTKDASNDQHARQELKDCGGEIKVPCLKIADGDSTQWMYESNDIIQYLDNRFGMSTSH